MARTLKSYRHFPVTEARDLLQTFNAERYKVVTVNWTYTVDSVYSGHRRRR